MVMVNAIMICRKSSFASHMLTLRSNYLHSENKTSEPVQPGVDHRAKRKAEL